VDPKPEGVVPTLEGRPNRFEPPLPNEEVVLAGDDEAVPKLGAEEVPPKLNPPDVLALVDVPPNGCAVG
jgi:hypothetical protein